MSCITEPELPLNRGLAKLYQRNEERDSKYSSLDDIYSDICDLSGVRVALYL